MTKFSYKALKDGKTITGITEAANKEALIAILAKQGLRTDRPGVDVSHASILATGLDVGALELLGLQRNLGLENLPGHLS